MSLVFQNSDPPPPSPPGECVLPPHPQQRRGVHTRPVLALDMPVLQQPAMDMSVIQHSVLPLDVSVLQQPVMDMSVNIHHSVLPLAVYVRQQPECAVTDGVWPTHTTAACDATERVCLEEPGLHLSISVYKSFGLHLKTVCRQVHVLHPYMCFCAETWRVSVYKSTCTCAFVGIISMRIKNCL
jgi:hypothetical protein